MEITLRGGPRAGLTFNLPSGMHTVSYAPREGEPPQVMYHVDGDLVTFMDEGWVTTQPCPRCGAAFSMTG